MVQEKSDASSGENKESVQPGAEAAPGSNSEPALNAPESAARARRQNFYIPRQQAAAGQTEGSNLPPDLRDMAQKTDFVERTKLDHIVLKDVLKKSFEEQVIKVSEQIKAQAAEPAKPFKPIDTYRQASPCSSTCAAGTEKEKVTFCEACHLQVYDFTGMELPEAEELIFKRENKRAVVLYKRQDGRFLTSDCPVGANKRQKQILVIAAGIIVALLGIAAAIFAPRPPEQANLPNEPSRTDQSAYQATPAAQNQPANPQVNQPPASTGYFPSPQPDMRTNNNQMGNDQGPSSAWGSSAPVNHPAIEPAEQFESDAPPDIVNSNNQQGQENNGAAPASPAGQPTTAPVTQSSGESSGQNN
jgi:hypothetical protein